MLRIFFIGLLTSLLCLVADCKKCKNLKDDTPEVPAEEFLKIAVEDALNVTKHINDYVSKLRDTLKNDNLPQGLVKYYLFTSEKPHQPYTLTSNSSFKNIPYDSKKRVVFGIHGYTSNASLDYGSTGELVQKLLELKKYNVIFVDYTKVSSDVLSVAVPKAYLAAKEMAKFLLSLMEKTGTKRKQIHLIGTSLGGQMSSIIGNLIPGLGRITGLEPGGTFFTDFPKDLRLDRSDANFVDVIHTADEYPLPKGWGFYKPCGHLDFYPNGGLFQPGCNSTIPIDQDPTTLKEVAARICMHIRVGIYYIESMCHECSFIGIQCESYEKFKKGMCTVSNSVSAVMGEFATKPLRDLPENTMFFLDTNEHFPFCKPIEKCGSSVIRKIINFLLVLLAFFRSLFDFK